MNMQSSLRLSLRIVNQFRLSNTMMVAIILRYFIHSEMMGCYQSQTTKNQMDCEVCAWSSQYKLLNELFLLTNIWQRILWGVLIAIATTHRKVCVTVKEC